MEQRHLAEVVSGLQPRDEQLVLVEDLHLATHDEEHLVARRALAADDVPR
jgi:hypothetical protein